MNLRQSKFYVGNLHMKFLSSTQEKKNNSFPKSNTEDAEHRTTRVRAFPLFISQACRIVDCSIERLICRYVCPSMGRKVRGTNDRDIFIASEGETECDKSDLTRMIPFTAGKTSTE